MDSRFHSALVIAGAIILSANYLSGGDYLLFYGGILLIALGFIFQLGPSVKKLLKKLYDGLTQ